MIAERLPINGGWSLNGVRSLAAERLRAVYARKSYALGPLLYLKNFASALRGPESGGGTEAGWVSH